MNISPGSGSSTSSSPGSMVMHTDGTPQKRGCICGSKDCRLLTKCFNSIGDIRGRFFKVPSTNADRNTEVKRFKAARICDHLNITGEDVSQACSQDNRNRSSLATPHNHTRSNTKTVKRKERNIAYHHFNPAVIQELVINQGNTTIDLIDENFLKQIGVLGTEYTDEDRYDGTVGRVDGNFYVPVPSYKQAKRDYKLASGRYRLNQIITSCRGRHRGETFLATRNEVASDTLKPVDQLSPMDENNVEHLQRAVCLLSDENNALREENNRLKDQINADRLIHRGTNNAVETFVKSGGLHRISISSDEYHAKHPKVAKLFFGFEDRKADNPLSSWEVTKQFILNKWGVQHEEPTINNKYDASRRSLRLSRFEQILITLMFFTDVYDYTFISSIFGVDEKVIGRVIKGWAPHFREVGEQMARLPLTKAFLDATYPETYHELNFSHPVATIVDGTDVACQTVRTDRYINVVQASNKIHASAARGITWSTPMGLVHEFTDPFFGRGSEKALVKVWTSHGRFRDLPAGYLVSGDKGFDGTSVLYPKYNPVIHPAFLTGGDGAQFTVDQMDWNRKACKYRYTSEVVFSRFKLYGGLGGIVPRWRFHYLRDLWAWAHGMANYYQCLQSPPNCDYFPRSKYSKRV